MKNFLSAFVLFILAMSPAFAAKQSWEDKCAVALNKAAGIVAPELINELKQKPTNKTLEVYFLVKNVDLKKFKSFLTANEVSFIKEEAAIKHNADPANYLLLKGSRANFVALFEATEKASKGANLYYSWAGFNKKTTATAQDEISKDDASAESKEGTYVLAVKRQQRDSAPKDWHKQVSKVPGVSVSSYSNNDVVRIVTINCSAEVAEGLRSQFPFLFVEEQISHFPAAANSTPSVLPENERTYELVLEKAEQFMIQHASEFGILSTGFGASKKYGGNAIDVIVYSRSADEAKMVAELIRARTQEVFEGIPLEISGRKMARSHRL